ncbi:hypothetical protein ACIP4S_32665 [Streptomyces chartreusis]|uniref:hypothetical protein n=1 Tax=Streptomyces chartreusis TaxID=1969 RepID=UPI0037FC9C40
MGSYLSSGERGLAAGKSTAAACNGWIVFEDEAGRSMTPQRARTWGRVGCTPAVRVRGRGSGRVSMAGMACYRPGGPIVLVWDNARIHLVPPLKEFFESNTHWLTVFQLPTYAPARGHLGAGQAGHR